MLYENYQNRIQKIAAFLAMVLKHIVLICAALATVVAITIGLLATKGITSKVKCQSNVIYGESYNCKATSFLSSVKYEYRKKDDVKWTDIKPTLPGDYEVRAVGRATGGKDRYGELSSFTIEPRNIDVAVSGDSVTFGDIPNVTHGTLAYSDKLSCTDFIYGDVTLEKTTVSPIIDSITVVDPSGSDVTSAYKINVVSTEITFLKRPLTVITSSSSNVYDANPFTFDQYQVASGTSLGIGDIVSAKFNSLTNVGTINNEAEIVIYHSDNDKVYDVTHQYDLSVVEGEISVTQRPIVITTGSKSVTYNGIEVSYNKFKIESEGYGLAAGHSINVLAASAPVNAGVWDNNMTFQILDRDGNDVTSNYSIILNTGTIEIARAKVEVVSGSASTVYDGEEHDHSVVTVEGVVNTNHNYVVVSSSSIKNVGYVENKVEINILDMSSYYDPIDVTSNYDIEYKFGTLEITPRPLKIVTVGGTYTYGDLTSIPVYDFDVIGDIPGIHQLIVEAVEVETPDLDYYEEPLPYSDIYVEVGKYKNNIYFYVEDIYNYEDVTSNYDITYEYGTIIVEPRDVTIITGSLSVVYDGEEHSTVEYYISEGLELLQGHHLNVQSYHRLTDAGKYENNFLKYTIETMRGGDVTDNYNITWEYGTIEIEKRPIYIEPEYVGAIYDGQSHKPNNVFLSYDTPYWLVDGDTLEANVRGERVLVGESESTPIGVKVIHSSGKDVTGNYDITKRKGQIIVYPRPILIRTASAEKLYNGEALTSSDYMLYLDGYYQTLVDGHYIDLTILGSQTDVGESYNYCDTDATRILSDNLDEPGGSDVTSNYDIFYDWGILTVTAHAHIVVTSYSDSKIYDGRPLTNPHYDINIILGELFDGHEIIVEVYGSITEIGSADNFLSVEIVDAHGNDVSYLYRLDILPGTLTISPEEEEEFSFGKIKNDRDGYIYLKMRSYGNFNGRHWNTALAYNKVLPGGLSYDYLTSYALVNSGGNINTVEFKDLIMYMLPYYMGLDGDYLRPSSDVEYLYGWSDFSMTYYSIPENQNGYDYLKGNLGIYAEYEEKYREFVYSQYLTIDGETLAYMSGIIEEQGWDINDPNVILKIARYIQGAASYNLAYDRQLDYESNVAIAFLDKYQEGKCTHYATAATLLYRALGIPARYVEGFMVQTKKDTFVDIKSPGHAWVEVYIDGVGWIQVEVTGSSSDDLDKKETITVTPAYTHKFYDGEYLYPDARVDADSALSYLLDEGYTYSVEISGRQLEIGTSASKIETFILYDPDGNDVTDNFNIIYRDGILQVLPGEDRVIKIYLYQLQKYYDGAPLSYADDDYEILYIPDGVEINLTLNISLTDVGYLTLTDINQNISQYASYQVYKNGRNVTSSYSIIFDVFEGTDSSYIPIMVSPRPIEITSASQSKKDDGNPLTNSNVFVSYGSLVEGHTLSAIAMGYIDSVGSVENTIDYFSIGIFDEDGKWVLSNYEIVMINNGTLTITE